MTDRRLTITRGDDAFLLGRLDDDKYSGVFLTPEYVSRLRQIRNAVERRRADGGNLLDSDALKNLFRVIDRLAFTHAAQLKTESYPGNQADRNEMAEVEKELEEIDRQLRSFLGPKNDPDQP